MSSSIFQDLKNIFGEIPSWVHDHIKYLSYNEGREEFTCKLCTRVIQKNAFKNLEAHLKSESHRKQSCSEDKVSQALSKSFGGKIPQIVLNNINVLDVVDEGYECVICEKTIKTSRDPMISQANFSYHLASSGHEEKLKDYDENIAELGDVYGHIPEIVDNNKEYLQLDRSGKHFVCKICNVLLKVNKNNIEQTENTFEEHFYSAEHVWGAKSSKVLSLIPELKYSKSKVHTYLIRNIDYISNNGADFFCSLCHENIKRNVNNENETEENLKHHIFSSVHEENMFSRQNKGNENLDNLIKVTGAFTDEVLKNVKYIELEDGYFNCSICDVVVNRESDCDEWNDNIINHLESDSHYSNVSEEDKRRTALIKNLEKIFGKIPLSLEENLAHIEFIQGNSFRCTLCRHTLQSSNLERHLCSRQHEESVKDEESLSENLLGDFEDLLGQDCEEKLPKCIEDNWSHIHFKEDSGHFHCTLCDETIRVDEGNKREEISLQNFKSHLFSAQHTTNLKQVATRKMKTFEKLESIFGGIPKCILNNVHVLQENDENSFFCNVCEIEIQCGSSCKTTKQNFLQHLRGSLHKSNINSFETSLDNAYKFLDEEFGVPECLLKNIDFWDNAGDGSDLYCTLCQAGLSVDLDDLKQTRQDLECHVDSECHKSNLEDLQAVVAKTKAYF